MRLETIIDVPVELVKLYCQDRDKNYIYNDSDKILGFVGCQESGKICGLAMIRKDWSVYIEWPLEHIAAIISLLKSKNSDYIRFESNDQEIVKMISQEFFNLLVEPLKIGLFEHDLSTLEPECLNPNVRILTDDDYELAYKWRLDMYQEAWKWNTEDPLTIKAAENDAKRYVDKRELRVMYEDDVPVCCASVIKRDDYVVFENVYVPTEFRGNRYSKQLMVHCLSEAKRNGFRSAMVTTPWSIAINLYLSIGFKRLSDFYSYQNK